MGNINSNMTEQTNHGKLHLFIGPMYSGKTSKLIECFFTSRIIKYKIVVNIRYIKRYPTTIPIFSVVLFFLNIILLYYHLTLLF